MQHDLLIDPINTVFAVNCVVEGSTLHCGALYLEPLVQSQFIRLAYDGASLEVEIPTELVNQTTPHRAWQVALPIRNEQVQRTSL
jgi:hypothetical protein